MTHDRRGWRELSHTADAGVEAWAPTLEDVYAVAAEGLFGAMGTPQTLTPAPEFEQRSAGMDAEDLLVRLLSDLVSQFAVNGYYVRSAKCVSLTQDAEWSIVLRCEGGVVDRSRERGLTEVKAVTYHGVSVGPAADGFRAQYYVDL